MEGNYLSGVAGLIPLQIFLIVRFARNNKKNKRLVRLCLWQIRDRRFSALASPR
jgi:hypothetical protein